LQLPVTVASGWYRFLAMQAKQMTFKSIEWLLSHLFQCFVSIDHREKAKFTENSRCENDTEEDEVDKNFDNASKC
jgi:hypothetical protein